MCYYKLPLKPVNLIKADWSNTFLHYWPRQQCLHLQNLLFILPPVTWIDVTGGKEELQALSVWIGNVRQGLCSRTLLFPLLVQHLVDSDIQLYLFEPAYCWGNAAERSWSFSCVSCARKSCQRGLSKTWAAESKHQLVMPLLELPNRIILLQWIWAWAVFVGCFYQWQLWETIDSLCVCFFKTCMSRLQ